MASERKRNIENNNVMAAASSNNVKEKNGEKYQTGISIEIIFRSKNVS
jgi:hypothetical protein